MTARHGRAAALAALLLLAGCPSIPYVAVPEARFRTEVAPGERLALPLDGAGRARLLAFLRAGGDALNVEAGNAVDLEAGRRYGPLLDRLAAKERPTLASLAPGGSYDAWFGKGRVRQVIDAREERPPSRRPIAASDGRYWWVFYPAAGAGGDVPLDRLLVARAIPADPPP